VLSGTYNSLGQEYGAVVTLHEEDERHQEDRLNGEEGGENFRKKSHYPMKCSKVL
jgi:hypothetical protein